MPVIDHRWKYFHPLGSGAPGSPRSPGRCTGLGRHERAWWRGRLYQIGKGLLLKGSFSHRPGASFFLIALAQARGGCIRSRRKSHSVRSPRRPGWQGRVEEEDVGSGFRAQVLGKRRGSEPRLSPVTTSWMFLSDIPTASHL